MAGASYKSADSSIDLDADGGPDISPSDISKSSWVHKYETKNEESEVPRKETRVVSLCKGFSSLMVFLCCFLQVAL